MGKLLINLNNKLIGSPEEIPLTERLFNSLSLIMGLFGIVSVTQNLLLKLDFYVVLLTMIGGFLLLLFYFLSRFLRIYRYLIWPLIISSTLLLTAVWFYNGGTFGGILFLFLVMTFFFIVITRKLSRMFAILWTVAVPVCMMTIERLHPELNIPYSDSATHFWDVMITYLISVLVLISGSNQVIHNYHIERKKALDRANELNKKNCEIERDLELAKQIQLSLIPSDHSATDIGFYYKPMEQVGGDFFDFINIDSDNLGIFVSDVSGHGVSAAFITSIMKSFTLQYAKITNDPADLLMKLNHHLQNKTAGNFITAFYGIYNKSTQILTYSNAGHHYPYLIKKSQIMNMDVENSGIPLAVMSNEEITGHGLQYQNNCLTLEKNSKILLYTDGLVEAVNIQDKETLSGQVIEDFEAKKLIEVLEQLRSVPGKELVPRLVEELRSFRGGNFFDDDVCIICLDVA